MRVSKNQSTVNVIDRKEALSILGISKEQDEKMQKEFKKGLKPTKIRVNKIKPTQKDSSVDRVLLSRMDYLEEIFDKMKGIEELQRLVDLEVKVDKIMKFLCI